MDEHNRHLALGLALVMGLLLIVPFTTMVYTGLTPAPVGQQRSDISSAVFATIIVACGAILYVVLRRKL